MITIPRTTICLYLWINILEIGDEKALLTSEYRTAKNYQPQKFALLRRSLSCVYLVWINVHNMSFFVYLFWIVWLGIEVPINLSMSADIILIDVLQAM